LGDAAAALMVVLASSWRLAADCSSAAQSQCVDRTCSWRASVVGQTSLHRLHEAAVDVDDDKEPGGRHFHAHEVLACTLLTGLCPDEASFLGVNGGDNLQRYPVNRIR